MSVKRIDPWQSKQSSMFTQQRLRFVCIPTKIDHSSAKFSQLLHANSKNNGQIGCKPKLILVSCLCKGACKSTFVLQPLSLLNVPEEGSKLIKNVVVLRWCAIDCAIIRASKHAYTLSLGSKNFVTAFILLSRRCP